MSSSLRFRQVHLDFHTSEKISGVGNRFNATQFQAALQRGHVDSVTLFSKCHHGMTYHDTHVGVRHPGMDAELLPQQLEACRAINVKTPIYISAGLDEAMVREHPEWTVKYTGGQGFDPLKPGYKLLCFNTPYLDYLCAQIEEVVDRFNGGDGIFLDIISAPRCYCQCCIAGMQARNLDPTRAEDVDLYAQDVLQTYYARTTAACKKGDDARRVFHNSGHIPKGARQVLTWNSHLELESLPTGGWGYDHFPLSAKYAATTGYDFLGMTGKFHTTWGEFGGFKRSAALRYECAAMLAFGSKCSIGDQLHPSGEMNEDTYALIGAAYEEVKAKEPWCENVKPVSEIALVSPEALRANRPKGHGDTSHAEEGAARMLLELHLPFDVVDLERDLSSYRLVILPDDIPLSGAFLAKIAAYREGGGKLLLSGDSGLNEARNGFALELGLDLAGRGNFDPDYIVPGDALPSAPVRGPFVIHGGAWNVRPLSEGVQILAHRDEPYFNRTWEHFCSHQHTPDARRGEFPAAVADQTMVYFAHHIFTRYRLYGQPLYRDLVSDAIRFLLPELSLGVGLPSTGRASLMFQPEQSRYILHLLYATPTLRGGNGSEHARAVEVIEDLPLLHDIQCSVKVPVAIRAVRLVPEGRELEHHREPSGAIRFVVPRLLCHQMIELQSDG